METSEKKPIKIFPYSYSSLESFETCPRKHYGERLGKEFARPFVQAASDGDTIHKQAELYALHGTDFENKYKKQIIAIVDELKSLGGEFYAEKELAVTRELTECGWWDSQAYCRNKLDLLHVNGDTATIIDWKTGKPNVFSTQLKLQALLVFMCFPKVNKVHGRYEWLKEGYATKSTSYREFVAEDWAKFENRVAKYDWAFNHDKWLPKPGFLCKKYCGVTTCENFGK